MSTETRREFKGKQFKPELITQVRIARATDSDDFLKNQKSPESPVSKIGPLSASDFNTAIVHFYRGELQRSNTWRNRLDTTSNWAVITAGATLSFAFSSNTNPHFVILINSVLVLFFLVMEARRYRYYELWSSRVRMIETGYYAQILSPGTNQNSRDPKWAERLANDLITPHFTISEWEAIGRRLRRSYLWIFVLLAFSWNLKIYLHPAPAPDLSTFINRATVGVVPGPVVISIGILFNGLIVTFAMFTSKLREATGEVLVDHDFSFSHFKSISQAALATRRATIRRAKRARRRVKSTPGGGDYKNIDITDVQAR